MTGWGWVAVACAAALGLYLCLVGGLLLAGRAELARAVAGLVPDLAVLFRRLLRDPRVSRKGKLVLGAVLVYLALPFDLIPDFIPVAGQLDDAVIVALALRLVLRGAGPTLVADLWPGPRTSLEVVLRLAGGRGALGSRGGTGP